MQATGFTVLSKNLSFTHSVKQVFFGSAVESVACAGNHIQLIFLGLLIQFLQNPALFPHEVICFKIIETHISWVLLTGQYAYKIKKPLNLGFLDFSTLEKRQHYSLEELRLNLRLAPDI